jgi:acyl carrier protein
MNFDQALSQVNDIFIEVLDDEDVKLAYETTADQVEDWDSLSHIQIIVAVENHFDVKFTTLEIQDFENVGQMCDAVVAKISGA